MKYVGHLPHLRISPSDQDLWATFVSGRSPEWKIHAKRGHAYNAMASSCEGHRLLPAVLFKATDKGWEEVANIAPPTFCPACGQRLKKARFGIIRINRLEKHPVSPAFRRPYVCESCYDSHFSTWAKDKLDPKIVRPM